jgi:hypothetical protein
MQVNYWSIRAALAASLLTLISGGAVMAADAPAADVNAELGALKARIAELEKKENENWLTAERTSQIKAIVQDVIADSKTRGNFADGINAGYDNGFFIQTADKNFKLVIGGFVQFRYTYAYYHNSADNTAAFKQAGVSQTNASGFDIRRARVSFSGNAFSPDIFYKLEGDFYNGTNLNNASLASTTTSSSASGSSSGVQTSSTSGNFIVTDAFLGYRWSDLLKLRAGSFKVPFTKVELMSDTKLDIMERPEENTPFDAQRAIGISLFGDIQKDKLGYEVNMDNGSNSNIYRRVTTANGNTAGLANYNYGNRPSFYARVNYAGAGTVSEFYSGEADLRKNNSDFIWMLGAAGGYESQNSTDYTFVRNTTTVQGIGKNDGPGFASNYVLNGDLFRGTADLSAKWQGWALNSAAYFQQVNANPGANTALPYGTDKASFFQSGYYAQLGYMIVPQKLELVGRGGVLLTEGDPNIGEYYTAGANYYLFGNNAKVSADVTYSPEGAFTDAGDGSIQNSHEVLFKLQLQLAF